LELSPFSVPSEGWVFSSLLCAFDPPSPVFSLLFLPYFFPPVRYENFSLAQRPPFPFCKKVLPFLFLCVASPSQCIFILTPIRPPFVPQTHPYIKKHLSDEFFPHCLPPFKTTYKGLEQRYPPTLPSGTLTHTYTSVTGIAFSPSEELLSTSSSVGHPSCPLSHKSPPNS